MSGTSRTFLVLVTIAVLFLAGCTAPADEDNGEEETATETQTRPDAPLPDAPEGAFFALGEAGPLGPGDRAAVGLLDDDDRYDLYLAGTDGGRLYYGTEDGGWTAASNDEGATFPGAVDAVAIGDLGDDDRDELVLVGPGGMTVFENGNHSYTRQEVDLGDLDTPERVTLADLDNDGWLDAVVGTADGGLFALFNEGDGTLGTPVALLDDADAGDGFVLMDVDDDLLLDIVVAPEAGGLSLWLNQPGENGTFAARGDRDGLPAEGTVTGLFPVDLDNDRRIDLLATTDDGVWFYENTGRVAFRDKSGEMGLPSASRFTAPVSVDVDIDGWQDVLFLDDEGALHLYWNAEGRGMRAKPIGVRTGGVTGLAAGDFDRDGRIGFLGLSSERAPVALDNVWDDGVWFGVHLVGANTTTTGIGSKVELTIGASFPMFRQVGGLADPAVAMPLDPHFGFGSVTGQGFSSDMALVILWPSGTFQGRDIPKDEGFDARVTARENTEELTWDEGGPC